MLKRKLLFLATLCISLYNAESIKELDITCYAKEQDKHQRLKIPRSLLIKQGDLIALQWISYKNKPNIDAEVSQEWKPPIAWLYTTKGLYTSTLSNVFYTLIGQIDSDMSTYYQTPYFSESSNGWYKQEVYITDQTIQTPAFENIARKLFSLFYGLWKKINEAASNPANKVLNQLKTWFSNAAESFRSRFYETNSSPTQSNNDQDIFKDYYDEEFFKQTLVNLEGIYQISRENLISRQSIKIFWETVRKIVNSIIFDSGATFSYKPDEHTVAIKAELKSGSVLWGGMELKEVYVNEGAKQEKIDESIKTILKSVHLIHIAINNTIKDSISDAINTIFIKTSREGEKSPRDKTRELTKKFYESIKEKCDCKISPQILDELCEETEKSNDTIALYATKATEWMDKTVSSMNFVDDIPGVKTIRDTLGSMVSYLRSLIPQNKYIK